MMTDIRTQSLKFQLGSKVIGINSFSSECENGKSVLCLISTDINIDTRHNLRNLQLLQAMLAIFLK